jgi:Xaa-Pro dipeptidase
MSISRRRFTAAVTGLAGAAALRPGALLAGEPDPCDLPDPIWRLKPMTAGAQPITDDERRARVAKAQRLMTQQGIGAILLEPGTSMRYFTGVGWSLSERTFALVLPARGEPGWICPAFEAARARELIRFGHDVRTWE